MLSQVRVALPLGMNHKCIALELGIEDESGVHTVHSSRHTNTPQIHRSRQVSKAKAYIPPLQLVKVE